MYGMKSAVAAMLVLALTGCASSGKYVATNLTPVEVKQMEKGELVKLQRVLPAPPTEKLLLQAAAVPRGVYVCAIESLSKPCLPKLSKLVADKLASKNVPIAADPSQADMTLYFETWFDSYSTHSSMVKALMDNPAVLGSQFAVKVEQGLATGALPDVHKHFRFAADPISLVTINSNDEQKFIYAAFTAVTMQDAISYPGAGTKHVGASSNPWVQAGKVPDSRTLIGNYDGEVDTDKAVLPMLNDALDNLLARSTQP